MAAPYSDLTEKLEEAYAAVIRAATTGIEDGQVYTSFSDNYENKLLPCVVISCQGGDEDGHNSGNFRLRVSVEVHTSADREEREDVTPRSLHRTNVARVFDTLQSDALAAELSTAVEDLTVFDSITRSIGPSRIEGRAFVSERSYEQSCAPSDIS